MRVTLCEYQLLTYYPSAARTHLVTSAQPIPAASVHVTLAYPYLITPDVGHAISE